MEGKMEIITSRSNSVCVHIRKLGASKSYRDEHGEFLCDGLRLLNEAVNSKMEIGTVLAADKVEVELPPEVRLFNAPGSLIDSLSPLKNSQGLLFTCKAHKAGEYSFEEGTHVLLDKIQDPGNVGAIIRSANAFGIKNVILTEGTADIYNPKAIRAAMGAIFRQSIIVMSLCEIRNLKKSGIKFVGTANDRNANDVTQENLADKMIVLGNEGQGISGELAELCDNMIRIPVLDNCESLNVAVASSIIMWEASRGKEICHH